MNDNSVQSSPNLQFHHNSLSVANFSVFQELNDHGRQNTVVVT